jgi:hypothetical protein
MMERLVSTIERIDAKIDANHAKTNANLKEMRAGQELLKDKMLAKMKPTRQSWVPRYTSVKKRWKPG